MFSIQTLDALSPAGLACLDKERFTLSNETATPHAILLRSTNIHQQTFADTLQVIGRAGAGTNNIPVEQLTQRGIPVFNTPGANANAVKELVLTGLLLASRNICQAWNYVRQLSGDNNALNASVEKNKKQFTGSELPGKTLGVIGLGNIGVGVANAAHHLGMKVLGYDPSISVKNAWQLSSAVEQADQLSDVLQQADFITLHIPLVEETKHLLNSATINQLKPGAIVLNFSREPIVEAHAMKEALDKQTVRCYVSDFPNEHLHNHPNAITLPHLGASTTEAQENCAIMIAEQVKCFLLDGEIIHSVNFPSVMLKRRQGHRISITNNNVPNMVAQISSILSDSGLNIIDMINKSHNNLAYNLIDLDQPIQPQQLQALQSIDGVLKTNNLN
jgi:D-3-phosphoglycerate dehydrogenase / 2-oxoglutarate reductase